MSETLANMERLGEIDYSTSEQWTGKRWIDGKKIYQCSEVISIPNVAASTRTWIYGNTVLSNLDTIIFMGGSIHSSDDSKWSLPGTRSPSEYVGLDVIGQGSMYMNRIGVLIQDNVSNYYTKAYVTVRYTKTTD